MGRKRNGIQDFLDGFNGTYTTSRKISADIEDARIKGDLANVSSQVAPTETQAASGEDALKAAQQAMDQRLAGATDDVQRTQIQADFKPTIEALTARRQSPASVVNSMGVGSSFQQRENQPFSKQEVDSAKASEVAQIYERAGRPDDALRTLSNASKRRDLADQDEIRAITNAPTPASVAAGGANQLRDPLDFYLKDIAPKEVQALLRQGKVAEAKQLTDFLDSNEGVSYAKEYMAGVRRFSVGDHQGALKNFENLYNRDGFPDGYKVNLKYLGGDQLQIDQVDASGKVVGSKTGKVSDLAEQSALALNPVQAVKFIAEQKAKRDSEAATLDRSIQLEGLRSERDQTREDRRDARLTRQLDARGGLTATQQRSNFEIDAARDAVSGMTQQDIMRRTAKATNTGRENPDYDPGLARQVALAGRRKVGDDEVFDRRGDKPTEPAAGLDRADVANRFRSDKSMLNFKLGKDTPKGVEVLDKNGRVTGHYR
ncbi:MAG: hypothetical protein EPO47_05100 [Rugosibacter sp.]|nr:MAG: hypothetical protein EPO60_04695 [Rugosibacter sp.]TBR09923.1 MAG: hypothetical protein EPO47_05100 [Rugosibacter sp.]